MPRRRYINIYIYIYIYTHTHTHIKVMFTLEQAMKTQKVSKGIALLFL